MTHLINQLICLFISPVLSELCQIWRIPFIPCSYGPKIMLAVVIPALDSVYSKIAIWLNDKGRIKKKAMFSNDIEKRKIWR
jgi:hypothetical protein